MSKQIIYGLEKYFNFTGTKLKESFVRHLIDLQHNETGNFPWVLKEVLKFDFENLPEEYRSDRLNTYTSISVNKNLNIELTVHLLSKAFPDDEFCAKLLNLHIAGEEALLASIFSRTQVLSKIWIGETISKFYNKFDNALLIGGWTTHHTLFFKNIKINNLFSIDIDSSINKTAYVFNPDVIIDNKDILNSFDRNNNILIKEKIQDFDLIINTSAEHMPLEWYDKIKPGTILLVQSNNMNDPDHINKSAHLGEFLRKYPVSKTFYRGELNFDSYSRFMVFGLK
jgi:hypothetical protein